MTMTVDEQVAAVKDRVAKDQRDQASAGHAYEVAMGQVQASVAALRAEFGVESLDGAQVLLEALRTERDTELARVTQALARSEEAS